MRAGWRNSSQIVNKLKSAQLRADALIASYEVLGGEYSKYVKQISQCCRFIKTSEWVCEATGEVGESLKGAAPCRARLCPTCQRLKGRKMAQHLQKAVRYHWEREPDDRILLLTLTDLNCEAQDLRASIGRMNEAYKRLMKMKRVKTAVNGAFKALEVTYNGQSDTYHPHFHVMLMVRKGYFSKRNDFWIEQAEWVEFWREALGVDYQTVVDVRAMKTDRSTGKPGTTEKSLRELTKYIAKPDGVYVWDDTLKRYETSPRVIQALHDGLKGVRVFSYSGCLAEAMRALKLEDVEKAVLTDDEDAPEGTRLIAHHWWRWHWGASSVDSGYRLVRSEYAAGRNGDRGGEADTDPPSAVH